MAFTVEDYMDLVRLLAEHPEWKMELRRLLLSEELLSLPEIARQLVEAQRRSEERLSRLEEAMIALTEAQRKSEEQIRELASGQQLLWEGQQRLLDRLDQIDGRTLEMEYREKAHGYFGRMIRRVKVIARESLEEMLEAHLSVDELTDALLVDLVVSGYLRGVEEMRRVYLAVEVSSVVDERDVARARRRAGLLKKAGYDAIPVVAGREVRDLARAEARDQGVAMVEDGTITLWEESLAKWLAKGSTS